jgi:hypothetical protein
MNFKASSSAMFFKPQMDTDETQIGRRVWLLHPVTTAVHRINLCFICVYPWLKSNSLRLLALLTNENLRRDIVAGSQMKTVTAILLVSLALLMTGCRGRVRLKDMVSPPTATVTGHLVTIHFGNTMFSSTPWIHPMAEIQGQTVYIFGYRTSREQNPRCVVRLPASVNPQSVSVVWRDPDGSKLRIPMICPLGNAYLNFCRNFQATYHDTPPNFFWCGPAPENGQTVLCGIRSGDPQGKAEARTLIGFPVTFDGEGVARGSDDLQTQDGIKIIVDLVPFQAVGPGPCGEWGAEVMGKLESVDFSNRVIHVEAGPEHWIVTWQL